MFDIHNDSDGKTAEQVLMIWEMQTKDNTGQWFSDIFYDFSFNLTHYLFCSRREKVKQV